jgi:hypothetical protein
MHKRWRLMSLTHNETIASTESTDIIYAGAVYASSSQQEVRGSIYISPNTEIRERQQELQTLEIDTNKDYATYTDETEFQRKYEEKSKLIGVLKDVMMISTVELTEFSLKKLIIHILRGTNMPILDVEIFHSENIGLYVLVILDCNARQALEYWLNIVDRTRELNIPIFVRWTGEVDVLPEEMGAYIGKILARMSIFLSTKEPIDVIKAIREEWGL